MPARSSGETEPEMIHPEDIHHLALVAADLQRGMEEVGEVYGVTWTTPRHLELDVRTAGVVARVPLSVVYAQQGPIFLELVEAVPGTVWAATPGSQLHHIGAYVEDVEAEIERLEGLGHAVEAAGVGADGRAGGWAYTQSPMAIRIEILDIQGREATGQWARGEIA